MFWPLILPLQITLFIVAMAYVCLNLFAKPRAWRRSRAFVVYGLISCILFFPMLFGIGFAVDFFRFGEFSYSDYQAINDQRFQRYLPEKATDIKMRKYAGGYQARYRNPEAEFQQYLDEIWLLYGERSAVKRGQMVGEGLTVDRRSLRTEFDGLNWDFPDDAVFYSGPMEDDGGGASYYFSPGSGLVFQRTGFW